MFQLPAADKLSWEAYLLRFLAIIVAIYWIVNMAAVPGTTRDFFELVKAIGESKSKQEEDRIIADEVGEETHFHNSPKR